MATVEAFGDGSAKGSIDYTYMDFISNWDAEGSSNSVAGSSGSVAPESSSVAPESSSSAESSSTMAVPQLAVSPTHRNLVVFDMQGRVIYNRQVNATGNVAFEMRRAGNYLVQAGNQVHRINVK
jgi:hypothetical protein